MGLTNLEKRNELFKFSGSFKEPEMESMFNNSQWPDYSTRIRIVSLLTGVAYLCGIYSDTLSLSGTVSFYYMMAARVCTFFTALFCVYATFGKFSKDKTQKALLFYFIFLTLSECFELLLIPEIGGQGLPLLLVIILVYCLLLPVPYSYSFGASLSATILYSTILLAVHGLPLKLVFPVIVTFLLISAISLSILRNMNRAKRSEAYAIMQLRKTNEELQNEIAKKQKIQKKLEELATKDELTNIYNRRHFIELAEKERQRAERSGQDLSLLFIDIDHFKRINDTYGHDIGDLIIKKLAEIYHKNIRVLDIFCRYGGEEFVILLPETDSEHALMTAERFRNIISQTEVQSASGKIKITVSIGVSTYRKKNMGSLDELLKEADIALYNAKKKGRNRVELMKPVDTLNCLKDWH